MPYKDIDKQREYQREWMAQRRSDYFKDKECAQKDENCSGNLELDHKDPSKKWKHKIWSYCKKKRDRELKKCQILCNYHHMKKTAKDILTMRDKAHGTIEGYTKWRCRCDKCNQFASSSPAQFYAGLSIDLAKELVYS